MLGWLDLVTLYCGLVVICRIVYALGIDVLVYLVVWVVLQV